MIPAFEKFFYPILKIISDGKVYNLQNLRDACTEYFALDEKDLSEKIKSGHSRLYDRVQWTMAYFYQAKLVDRIKRGQYVITQEGKKLVDLKIENISINYLKEHYESFREFSQRSSAPKSESENSQQNNDSQQSKSDNDSKTPIDIIDDSFRLINQELAEELLQQVKSQSPKFFEHLVIDLLVKMGYGGQYEDGAFVTQQTRDEGIDGIIKEDKLGLDKIYVQAKRWDSGSIGRKEIQVFVGALSGQGASKGVFITTSTFTKDAKEFRPQNNIKIVLIDGIELCRYLIEYNIGVSVKATYEIKRIDSDYFDE